MVSQRTVRLVGVGLFLFSLGVYVFTMAPDLTWGDSGELVADVYTLGIPHPTGYPLYVLVGRIFLLIPIGSPACRMNLFSGFCAAAAVLLIYRTALLFVRRDSDLTGRIEEKKSSKEISVPGGEPVPETGAGMVEVIAAASAALALAVSPLFWSQATMAEVYATASLLGALLLFTAIRCRRAGSVCSLEVFALALGLVLVHHLLLVLLLPVAVYLIASTIRRHAKPAVLGRMFLFLLIGLSPILYLYLRGISDPVLNWGGVDSGRDVIRTWTGRAYGGGLANPFPALLSGDPERLRGLARYFSPWFAWVYSQHGILLAAALLGTISWWFLRKWFALLCLLTLLAAVMIPACYQVGDPFDFFYVFPLALTLPLAEGIVRCARAAVRFRSGWIRASFLLVLLAFLRDGLPDSWEQIDRSGDTGAADYARGVFEIARDARVIVTGIGANQMARDNEIHTLWYGKYVLHNGEGPVILGANFLGRPWYDERLREKEIPGPDWDGLVAAGKAIRRADGSVLFASRDNWIEALARDVLIPALEEGPVYSTGRIPGPWQGIRFVEAGRIPIDPQKAHPTQQPLLPSGIVYRLEKSPHKEGP